MGDPVLTVVARLDVAPAYMPESNLRATLVWLNSPPFGGGRCEGEFCQLAGRKYTVLTTSDVEVDMEFPLTVRLGMFELPNPISGRYEGTVVSDSGEIQLNYNSLPEAEVVLYEDGNGNQQLDLLPPGQPGPGPDRIVALSSGRDEQGVAVRTAVINKRSPIPAGFANNPDAPALDLFAFPLPKELTDRGFPNTPDALFLPPGVAAPPVHEDGVYALRLSAPASLPGVQNTILNLHSLVAEPDTVDAVMMYRSVMTVEPIANTVVRLFPVTPDRVSWLARGCNPFDEHTNTKVSPPPGADVQCGVGALRYATNPNDYCGQTRILDDTRFIDYTGGPAEMPAWWPCDEQGRMKPGMPYRAAPSALEDTLRSASANVNSDDFATGQDGDCSTGRIYHYDAVEGLRIPTAPPPPGSEIMCYGSDALSYIPKRTDGCRIKYTYELAGSSWDLRDSRPAWWPCGAQGQLRADSGYVTANTQPATVCPPATPPLWPRQQRLPGHARVRCDSPMQLTYAPLWTDGCEPLRFSMASKDPTWMWSPDDRPDWWPCDADGNFTSGNGYLPW